MWTVIYVAQTMNVAQRLINILSENEVIARLRCDGEDDGGCFEVLVPETELEAAQNIIFENDLF